MTITDTIPRTDFVVQAGDVGGSVISYNFEIFTSSDLIVTKTENNVISAPLTEGVDYTVSGVGNNNGGTITLIGSFASSLALGQIWSLVRDVAADRSTDFQTSGSFLASEVNRQLDKVFAIVQELEVRQKRRFGFADAVPDADSNPASSLLNLTILQRASKVLAFDSNGFLTAVDQASGGGGGGNGLPVDELDNISSTKDKLVSNVLAYFWQQDRLKGTDVPSASAVNIAAVNGHYAHITGTATINTMGTVQAGVPRIIRAGGAFTIVNSASIICLGGANIVAAADDTFTMISEGSNIWRMVSYQRANGQALVGSAVAAALPTGYYKGVGIQRDSVGDFANDTIFQIGAARSSDDLQDIKLTALLTKRLDAAHAVGTGNGGLFSGAKAADTWYHCFLIRRDSDGVIDAGYDTDINAANRPVGFTSFRRVGAVLTDSGNSIIQYDQFDGNLFVWRRPVDSFNSSAFGTVAVQANVIVPPGIQALTLLNVIASRATEAYLSIASANASSWVPSETVTPYANMKANAEGLAQSIWVISSTIQEVNIQSTAAATTVRGSTQAYRDPTLG